MKTMSNCEHDELEDCERELCVLRDGTRQALNLHVRIVRWCSSNACQTDREIGDGGGAHLGPGDVVVFPIRARGLVERRSFPSQHHCTDDYCTTPLYCLELVKRSHHTFATPFLLFGKNSEITPTPSQHDFIF